MTQSTKSIKSTKSKLRSLAYIARRHDLHTYSFAVRGLAWLVAVRAGLVFACPVSADLQHAYQDIRHPSAQKDWLLFSELVEIGKSANQYQLVFRGPLFKALCAYPSVLLARSGTHIFGPRWRAVAVQHAKYMNRYGAPCCQIAEDISRARLMVRLNYRVAGSFFIFCGGVLADYAAPIYEDCRPALHFRERPLLKAGDVAPYLRRSARAIITPTPTPPPTLDQIAPACG